MTMMVFLGGMFLAAIFAIFAYGYLGIPPSHEKNWVDYWFWGILITSFMPLFIEGAWALLRAFKTEFAKLFHRLHLT